MAENAMMQDTEDGNNNFMREHKKIVQNFSVLITNQISISIIDSLP